MKPSPSASTRPVSPVDDGLPVSIGVEVLVEPVGVVEVLPLGVVPVAVVPVEVLPVEVVPLAVVPVEVVPLAVVPVEVVPLGVVPLGVVPLAEPPVRVEEAAAPVSLEGLSLQLQANSRVSSAACLTVSPFIRTDGRVVGSLSRSREPCLDGMKDCEVHRMKRRWL